MQAWASGRAQLRRSHGRSPRFLPAATRPLTIVNTRGTLVANLYGPDDTWPKHDEPDIRRALAEAQAAGWLLKHPSGHWGRVVCPAYKVEYPHCYVRVDHTPRTGPAVRAIRRGLKNCEHAKGDEQA